MDVAGSGRGTGRFILGTTISQLTLDPRAAFRGSAGEGAWTGAAAIRLRIGATEFAAFGGSRRANRDGQASVNRNGTGLSVRSAGEFSAGVACGSNIIDPYLMAQDGQVIPNMMGQCQEAYSILLSTSNLPYNPGKTATRRWVCPQPGPHHRGRLHRSPTPQRKPVPWWKTSRRDWPPALMEPTRRLRRW